MQDYALGEISYGIRLTSSFVASLPDVDQFVQDLRTKYNLSCSVQGCDDGEELTFLYVVIPESRIFGDRYGSFDPTKLIVDPLYAFRFDAFRKDFKIKKFDPKWYLTASYGH